MGAFVRYTVLRLGLFLVCLALLSLVADGFLVIVFAAVVSSLLSYLLLDGPREALARAVNARASRRSRFAKGLDDDASAEDDVTR